jgi:hypothetical protein
VDRYDAPGPWTQNCIKKAPSAKNPRAEENTNSDIIGRPMSAKRIIARLRPTRSESAPTITPR